MGLLILLLCFFASLAVGAADISLGSIYTAFTAFDGSTEHLIIRTVRLPRSLIATFVGAALAVAGAIMQGITHNPLASPSILGVNAGAAFAVVVATLIFGSSSLSVYAWFAFLGAGITAVMVYLLGSLGRGGLTSLNLTIAGAALTAFISSITSGILIISQRTLEEIRFWIAGSIAGRELDLFMQVLPYLGVGLLLAFALGRQITTLSLGEDVAKGLGQQTAWVKIAAAVSVVLLAGGSVAIAGPIGFIGLIIPHMSRFLVGVDYRWILPYAPMLGAILLLVADTCARIVIQPQELPVGLVMPLIGAPFFIYLIRSKVKR
ncbi:MAG: iron ABC transporter permease [Cyanobacteria bacterium QH_9_48_43]|jgi:iron complex transport system permease protein|nr:MAG: iron ABC transporter permease [Cyanobacteria bacterium QH_10_48_56]PSO65115.1 MAG: iron ABC transporter permease [Cyanobacteria bacterium QH_2_48_84]PSO75338.1 MAG: iron ABC transporter permease [Cyanobacteria bacterium QS_1_48_34]PSO77212.1 MAG: iron ABC transporter permease [Cyanobacteria bacterium QS_4_48_99]PSO83889.1 MAG: iron ABC transporter permease [Cyanobacteria bacterium QH_9_48_43]PSO99954.1 MAG: iron ABC transporter permease [Cyanobacteria bacterium SW_6_48_11]PSP09942.1 M